MYSIILVSFFIFVAAYKPLLSILDFFILDKTIKNLKDKLDHSYLNDIKEIKTPTLENIGSWIWKQIKPKLKNLHKVEIERKTCGESFSISN